MKIKLIIILSFLPLLISAQVDNLSWSTQKMITYDTASVGQYVGYFYARRNVSESDTLTGSITFSEYVSNSYFSINSTTGLVTIQSTPTAGTHTYYVLTELYEQDDIDTVEITVYDADYCVFDEVRSGGNWHHDTTYFFARGSTISDQIRIMAQDDNVEIGAWGQGERPVFNFSSGSNHDVIYISTYIDDYTDSTTNNLKIFSLDVAGRIYGEPSYNTEIWDCKVENENDITCIYTKESFEHEGYWEMGGGIYNCELYKNADDNGHGMKIAPGTDAFNNYVYYSIGNAISCGFGCDIKYNAINIGAGGIRVLGDSCLIEYNWIDSRGSYGIRMGHALVAPIDYYGVYNNIIRYNRIINPHGYDGKGIDIAGIRRSYIHDNVIIASETYKGYRGINCVKWTYEELDYTSDSNYIYNNIVADIIGDDSDGVGIKISDSSCDTIYNNVIYGSQVSDLQMTGSGTGHLISNNTIDGDIDVSDVTATTVNNYFLTSDDNDGHNIDIDTITTADHFTNYAGHDYSLLETAYSAIDNSTDIIDFDILNYTKNGIRDIGAYEYLEEIPSGAVKINFTNSTYIEHDAGWMNFYPLTSEDSLLIENNTYLVPVSVTGSYRIESSVCLYSVPDSVEWIGWRTDTYVTDSMKITYLDPDSSYTVGFFGSACTYNLFTTYMIGNQKDSCQDGNRDNWIIFNDVYPNIDGDIIFKYRCSHNSLSNTGVIKALYLDGYIPPQSEENYGYRYTLKPYPTYRYTKKGGQYRYTIE